MQNIISEYNSTTVYQRDNLCWGDDDLVYIFNGFHYHYPTKWVSINIEPSTSAYWQVFKNYSNNSYMTDLFNKMIEGMK